MTWESICSTLARMVRSSSMLSFSSAENVKVKEGSYLARGRLVPVEKYVMGIDG